MNLFFLYLLPDTVSDLNYNFIIVELMLNIKDILHMKNHLNMRDVIVRGCEMKCV